MTFRFSCPYTSPQNGKAERKIRTINNLIRTLLAHAHLPPSFWHHALQMATYLLNILPSKLLSHNSPTQILYHRNPSYGHLRVFGCLCYPLTPSTKINKLQPRSSPCVFLGYPPNHRGYSCYDLSNRKFIISRHVIFDETIFPFATLNNVPSHSYDFVDYGINPYLNPTYFTPTATNLPPAPTNPAGPTEHPSPSAQLIPPLPAAAPQNPHPTYPVSAHQQPGHSGPIVSTIPGPALNSSSSPSPVPRTMSTRSMHDIFMPKRHFNLSSSVPPSPIPRNPKDALSDPNWKAAMLDEFNALINNKT